MCSSVRLYSNLVSYTYSMSSKTSVGNSDEESVFESEWLRLIENQLWIFIPLFSSDGSASSASSAFSSDSSELVFALSCSSLLSDALLSSSLLSLFSWI